MQFKRSQSSGTNITNANTSNLIGPAPFDHDFYDSLRSLYEISADLIVKTCSSSLSNSKDLEFISSFKCFNRSLAMFVKVGLLLNRVRFNVKHTH